MRGSDVVDLALDLLPRRWVKFGLLALILTMTVTHWYEPVIWYALDKASGLSERLTPIIQNILSTVAATPANA